MRKRLTLSVPVLLIFLSVTGCARRSGLRADPDITEVRRQQWLSKASRIDKNGWIFLHIEGEPFERGFQRGYLTAGEIDDFYRTLCHLSRFRTAREPEYFVDAAWRLFKGRVCEEYVEEIRGMVAGMRAAGREVTFEKMLYMNGFIDIGYWWSEEKESMGSSCSAFIATGEATADGRIVMAHNSWIGYAIGRFANIVIEIVPRTGHRIIMQSWGPCIYSATDFFITSAGLIGTETTIGGFGGFDRNGTPVFQRARQAMQYAESIDDWVRIMVENNNGAYANSWLIGDIGTNEIARLELGLKHHSFQRTANGYFCGSNITEDLRILCDETTSAYDDIRDRRVARRERWKQLMKQYHGAIDVDVARKMLADHYDTYLRREAPSCRTICGHYELDDGSVPGTPSAYRPAGAVDGKVVDSTLAGKWRLWAKWGSSCDIGFDADEFLAEHTQYDWMEGYLRDIPAEPWILLPPEETR